VKPPVSWRGLEEASDHVRVAGHVGHARRRGGEIGRAARPADARDGGKSCGLAVRRRDAQRAALQCAIVRGELASVATLVDRLVLERRDGAAEDLASRHPVAGWRRGGRTGRPRRRNWRCSPAGPCAPQASGTLCVSRVRSSTAVTRLHRSRVESVRDMACGLPIGHWFRCKAFRVLVAWRSPRVHTRARRHVAADVARCPI